jgi:hypothetical protein
MLANRGLDRCQAPAVGGRMDASKQGSRSGARHLLGGGGWMLANRGLDLVPGTCYGAAGWMLANRGLDLVPGTCYGAAGC